MRSLPFATLLLLATSSLPAAAQFEQLKLALCKKITPDDARLKCYDSMFTEDAAKPGASPAPKPASEWSITDSKSPVDDSPQITAIIEGENKDEGLILRCMERKIEAAVAPGAYFFASERAQVLIRINDLPPSTSTWSVSSNNKAVFAPSAEDFIKLLPDDGKLFVRVTGFQGKQTDATFNLVKVSAARDRIVAACSPSAAKSAKGTK
ncbi:type VI secretion system-associated protein TagO [Tardiphaga robiniae]|uniref:type VI secretion system-associated protein TagO n=1 Tax=Tardiphaga robiniae TaxID=943830 RepID=UPI0015867582|nr:type VI secretion system-associated protein TagO [Tardiphaga robiniae]NUU40364.1 hypothetical protein [Tardiphaga robiniae]